MFVVNHHFDVFVIDGPWSNIAEILHVFVGAGNDDLGLCSAKFTAVSVPNLTDVFFIGLDLMDSFARSLLGENGYLP